MTDSALPGGALCLSLDFELFWGVRDHARLDQYRQRLLGARQAVPRMLEAFAAHGVQATWATVGLLMCRDKDELLASLPSRLPQYAAARLSPYTHLESVGKDEADDPFHFAPSLLEQIRQTPGQEIGCHTFGHYYCQEAGQTSDDFAADLDAALALAHRRGITLTSLVLPRNQITPAYLPLCAERGLLSYRGLGSFFAEKGRSATHRIARLINAHAPLAGSMAWPLAEAGQSAPLNLRASHFLRLKGSAPLHLRRLCKDMEHAARTGRVLHLWWHPHNFGQDLPRSMSVLEQLLRQFTRLREEYGMQSRHMAGLARLAGLALPGQSQGREHV